MAEHVAEESSDSSIRERKRDASLDAALAPHAIPTALRTLQYCRRLLAAESPPRLEDLMGLPFLEDQVEDLERAIMEVARPFLVAAEARLEADLRRLAAALTDGVEAAIGAPESAGEEG